MGTGRVGSNEGGDECVGKSDGGIVVGKKEGNGVGLVVGLLVGGGVGV